MHCAEGTVEPQAVAPRRELRELRVASLETQILNSLYSPAPAPTSPQLLWFLLKKEKKRNNSWARASYLYEILEMSLSNEVNL